MDELNESKISQNCKWLLAMVACFSLGNGAYWVLLNLYFKQAGLAEGFIGEIAGLVALGSIIATIPIAWLCGRMQIKWLLITSIFLNVAGDALLINGASEWTIRIGAIISGMGLATWMTAVAPFIMRNSQKTGRGRLFSYKHGIGMAASGVASITFAYLVDYFIYFGSEIADAYVRVLVMASVCKLCAVIFGLFITPMAPLAEERREFKDFLMARDWYSLLRLTTPMLLIGFGAGMTMPFMNLYFQQRFYVETGTIGIYFFICTLFMAAGTLYSPKLALKKGNIRVVILTQFLSLPFMLILAFTGNIAFALVAFFARATLMNMGHPLYHHFSMEVVEVKEQASTNAFQGLSWNGGWFLGSWLGGISIELHGFTPTIIGTAICYFLATALQVKMFSDTSFNIIGRGGKLVE